MAIIAHTFCEKSIELELTFCPIKLIGCMKKFKKNYELDLAKKDETKFMKTKFNEKSCG